MQKSSRTPRENTGKRTKIWLKSHRSHNREIIDAYAAEEPKYAHAHGGSDIFSAKTTAWSECLSDIWLWIIWCKQTTSPCFSSSSSHPTPLSPSLPLTLSLSLSLSTFVASSVLSLAHVPWLVFLDHWGLILVEVCLEGTELRSLSPCLCVCVCVCVCTRACMSVSSTCHPRYAACHCKDMSQWSLCKMCKCMCVAWPNVPHVCV